MGEHIWGWIFRVLSQGWEVENKAESIDIGHFLMTQGSYPGEGTEDALLTRVIRNPLVTAGGGTNIRGSTAVAAFRRPRLTVGDAALDLGSMVNGVGTILEYQRRSGGT